MVVCNGNIGVIPKASDPTSTLAGTYDAWNRLVKLVDDSDTVAEYEYDARHYRIVTKSYVDNALDETRHTYYTNGWQAIEERIDAESTPDRQFVWGLRYIDDLILRDRTTTSELDERLYALQDANWNVTAVVDDGGTVQERYEYDPYGVTTFYSPSYTLRSSSSYDWETTYCGYRWEDTVGLFAVRFRWYSPRLATWVSRDPVGYAAGVNLYGYVKGMPTGAVDPEGLKDCFIHVYMGHNINVMSAIDDLIDNDPLNDVTDADQDGYPDPHSLCGSLPDGHFVVPLCCGSTWDVCKNETNEMVDWNDGKPPQVLTTDSFQDVLENEAPGHSIYIPKLNALDHPLEGLDPINAVKLFAQVTARVNAAAKGMLTGKNPSRNDTCPVSCDTVYVEFNCDPDYTNLIDNYVWKGKPVSRAMHEFIRRERNKSKFECNSKYKLPVN